MAKIKGDTVNFEGVESGGGGGGAKVPEDDYRAKVIKLERRDSKEGNDMLVWRYEITEGKYKGKKLKPVYTVIKLDSLWKLKNVLEALGLGDEEINIPKVMKKALGKECGITVVDGEEYNGKVPSEIAEHMSLDEFEELESAKSSDDEDDDEDDDEPKAKKKGKKNKKGKKKDDDEDLEEMDLDEV